LKAPDTVRAVALTNDGKMLASGGDDGPVQLWDPVAGKEVRKLEGPKDWLLAVAFSMDGKYLAAGGQDGKLWVWEVASGKKVFDVAAQPPVPPKAPQPPVNVVTAVAFSSDGKQISLGGTSGKVLQFQAADGKFQRETQAPGHTAAVTALAYHPGDAVLVSAGKDRALRFWNPTNGQALKTLEGHTAWAQGVVFLDKGTRIASVGADKTARVWDLIPPAPKKK
jgi:WD40 repeat protein